MYATFHFDNTYGQFYALNQYLAVKLNMPVLSINYRGGPGYGVAFRAANASGWQGASEYSDILAGALYLRSRPEVDGNKIGIHGLSYASFSCFFLKF